MLRISLSTDPPISKGASSQPVESHLNPQSCLFDPICQTFMTIAESGSVDWPANRELFFSNWTLMSPQLSGRQTSWLRRLHQSACQAHAPTFTLLSTPRHLNSSTWDWTSCPNQRGHVTLKNHGLRLGSVNFHPSCFILDWKLVCAEGPGLMKPRDQDHVQKDEILWFAK